MRLTLTEPKYLKESITIISDLVNEAQLKIGKDAIELIAMDPANVAMVIFKLLSSSFTEYEVEKETTLTINLGYFKQILRRANSNDIITIEFDRGSKLKIQLKSTSVRTFSIPIIDSQEKEQRVPDLNFPVLIEMDSTILNEAVEDVDIVSESVNFIVEPKKFIINAEGDSSEANIEIKQSDETTITSSKEKVSAKYSVEYLKKMIQGSKLADKVKIQFNKDYPLKIDYHTIDKVMLSFILAPRVESE
jgi:proliferating cell nuclear antigen